LPGPVAARTPPTPPPQTAVCRDGARKTSCDFLAEGVPVKDPIPASAPPGGPIYETSHYHGAGTRWYVNRLVVRRHVAASLDGTWSLSPIGAGPTGKITGYWGYWTVWTTPGEDSPALGTSSRGSDFKPHPPGF